MEMTLLSWLLSSFRRHWKPLVLVGLGLGTIIYVQQLRLAVAERDQHLAAIEQAAQLRQQEYQRVAAALATEQAATRRRYRNYHREVDDAATDKGRAAGPAIDRAFGLLAGEQD